MRGIPMLSEFARVLGSEEIESMFPNMFRTRTREDNQSQESKDYHLKKAEEKRLRKMRKKL